MKTLLITLSLFLSFSTIITAQTPANPEIEKSQKSSYSCPMHPEETKLTKGECGKCGMKLVKNSKSKHNSSIKGSQRNRDKKKIYECSMCNVSSDKPGKCPKCKMNMTKVESDKKEENHKH
jgi:ribosomal protein L37AE/L43A